ncbi:hypothetical protein MYMA111404_02805 [Mycoplasma marinum]|uniref:Uncharacterized protein n=1 Tax=Mycoplasma marinum TaxID=1937190 RepID=A0A4R0XPJ9_9MOLU|nr:hypothetical protein [Mycoplasma marinum]TCG10815.1 hypothetical protein C4B24_03745 [Mycoplasma marinum]
MKSKLFKLTKTHIYIFGILANVIPLIGLAVLGWDNFSNLNKFQLWAWIAGAIYYVFMWTVALSLWNKLDNAKKETIKSLEKIAELEKRIENLEK